MTVKSSEVRDGRYGHEVRILYDEGDVIRVLRGTITSEDNIFITVTRRDGTIKINKSRVIKIEDWHSDNGQRCAEGEGDDE
jgi:hypothetical protein